jgi:hypothetical protein
MSTRLKRALRLMGLIEQAERLRQLIGSSRSEATADRLSGAFRTLARRRYRELALIWHPDLGGDPDVMKQINAAWALVDGLRFERQPDLSVKIIVFIRYAQPTGRRPLRCKTPQSGHRRDSLGGR